MTLGQFKTRALLIRDSAVRAHLVSEFETAAAAGNTAETEIISSILNRIVRDSFWRYIAAIALGLALVFLFYWISKYFFGLTNSEKMMSDAMRPVIVFMLIIAMLVFGGILIFRPLFSDEDKDTLVEKFRLSREIFGVFSAIFATVIGFYFGSLDKPANDPAPLTMRQEVESNGTIRLVVAGGTPPYTAKLKPAGQAARDLTADPDDQNSFLIALDPKLGCPAGTALEIADSANGKVGDAVVALDKVGLADNKWVACAAAAAAPANPAPAAPPAEDSVAAQAKAGT